MTICGRSDEDQIAKIKERWSSLRGDRGPLLTCDIASSGLSKLSKLNGWPGFKLRISSIN